MMMYETDLQVIQACDSQGEKLLSGWFYPDQYILNVTPIRAFQ